MLLSLQLFAQDQKETLKSKGSDIAGTWKFGVALYTFHSFPFPESLVKTDSAGVEYIEGFCFQKAGADLKDSLIMQLSPAGIEKLKQLIKQSGFKMESMYVFADKTIDSWKKQFDIARQLDLKFVTGEPPIDMWDSIDSLAGSYGIRVAIHEHWKGMSPYWHPDSVLAALKNHPNFGVCADLGHWPKSGINPVKGLKKLKGHIIAIHLKDIAAYNNIKILDVPVGTGVVNFPDVFKELKRQKFNGYIYIERDAEDKPNNLPSVIATVKYYNTQLGLPQDRKKPFADIKINTPVADTNLSNQASSASASALKEYSGSYKMPDSSEVHVIKMISRDGDLFMQPGDYPEMKLTFKNADEFEETGNNIRIVFIRKDGMVTEARFTYQGKDSVGIKE
jgi:sugar phosphate isomerase/epimerase